MLQTIQMCDISHFLPSPSLEGGERAKLARVYKSHMLYDATRQHHVTRTSSLS